MKACELNSENFIKNTKRFKHLIKRLEKKFNHKRIVEFANNGATSLSETFYCFSEEWIHRYKSYITDHFKYLMDDGYKISVKFEYKNYSDAEWNCKYGKKTTITIFW